MTRVSVSLGYTRNMGNFESLRVDIGVEDDAREGETAKDAHTRVYKFVESLLIDRVRELESEIKSETA